MRCADVLGQDAAILWHKDETLGGADCVVLPGGFSYGDYLRCGAIARFSPIMKSVTRFAAEGGLVIGICNGFQILCEAHLLPGALMRNRSLSFICDFINVRIENAHTPFTRATRAGEILRLPIKHGEGCFVAPAEELAQIEERGQVLLRYVDDAGIETDAANPNGSMRLDRGRRQRSLQRLWPDAASGTRRRKDGRRRQRAQDFSIDHRGRAMSLAPVALRGDPVDRRGAGGRARTYRGRVRDHRAHPQPRADVYGVGRFLGDVVGALLLQIVAQTPAHAPDEGAQRRRRSGRERGRD